MVVSVLEDEIDRQLRLAAIAWLSKLADEGRTVVTREVARSFTFNGQSVPLLDPQAGIWKPRFMRGALSICTVYTRPGVRPPYDDQPGPDNLMRYKYRGTDPQHYQNVALRAAVHGGMPLIWFYGISEGLYQPIYPVWLAADEPARLQVVVALEESQLILDSMPLNTVDRRRYAERVTRQRLHQPAFRAQVLLAYRSQCAICRLRHESLLDAAHITPDREVRGLPLVSNGMALCKIHHAAYDKHIIGIRPDRIVEVRTDVLREIDGPMLQHGLQDMHNVRLTVPDSPRLRPNRQALEERYAIFRSATV